MWMQAQILEMDHQLEELAMSEEILKHNSILEIALFIAISK